MSLLGITYWQGAFLTLCFVVVGIASCIVGMVFCDRILWPFLERLRK
ncbi:hypothetical protein [Polaromonas sp. YR568]